MDLHKIYVLNLCSSENHYITALSAMKTITTPQRTIVGPYVYNSTAIYLNKNILRQAST